MTVRIARGVVSRIREHRDGFVLQVRSADPTVAAEALRVARAELYGLDLGREETFGLSAEDRVAPSMVSDVIPTPVGPMLYIDAGDVPGRLLRRIPEVVAAHLEAAGLHDATVAVPERGGPMDAMYDLTRSVSLHLWPVPVYERRGTPHLPWEWVEASLGWLGARVDGSMWGNVSGVQFELSLPGAEEFLRAVHAAKEFGRIAGGTLDARAAALYTNWSAVVVGVAGAGWGDDDLAEAFSSLVALGRSFAAGVGGAFVVVGENALPLLLGHPPDDLPPSCVDWSGVQWVSDELLVDAFCWQVLGPGHVERLGGVPPDARSLEAGRWEVIFGTLADWLPGSPRRDVVQAEGRKVLSPCLVDSPTARAILKAKTQNAAG